MLVLEGAKAHFKAARCNIGGENEEARFYHQFAEMIPDTIGIDDLVLAFKLALMENEQRRINTLPYLTLVPLYVAQCAGAEFSHQFRLKYFEEIIGIEMLDVAEPKYEVVEVDEDLIDISKKDKYAVLAALYNHSAPLGMGLAQYNPMTWTPEVAKGAFKYVGEERNPGEIWFGYVKGRPIKSLFVDNLVNVAGYNRDNEMGLAQKVIATVPNLPEVEEKYSKELK